MDTPTSRDHNHNEGGFVDFRMHHRDNSSGGVSPLEQQVLDEYARLAGNMEKVSAMFFWSVYLLSRLFFSFLYSLENYGELVGCASYSCCSLYAFFSASFAEKVENAGPIFEINI